jgi:hypothetical protein
MLPHVHRFDSIGLHYWEFTGNIHFEPSSRVGLEKIISTLNVLAECSGVSFVGCSF